MASSSKTTKRVHWAPTDQSYSPRPIPQTPSPSWSDSSLPESSPPSTPPMGMVHVPDSPEHKVAKLHPLLAYHPQFASPTAYDVTRHPSHMHLPESVLAQPASYPPLPSLEIHIPQLPCWKPIVAVATTQAGVTVADVLNATDSYMQRLVSKAEYASFPADIAKATSASFARRCRREGGSKSGIEAVQAQGLKRLDCLMGSDLWAGLVRSGRDPRVFQLHLAPLQR